MKRPMLIIGFVYLFALAMFQNIPEENLVFALVISAAVCICLALIPFFRGNKAIVLAAITLTFAAGVSLVNFKINIEPIQKYDEREDIISGIVDDLPYEKNGTLHYKIKVDHVGEEDVRPFNVMIFSGAPLECDFGDRFYCTAHFYTPQSSYFFDSKQYYHARKIYINAYVKNPDETYTSKNVDGGLKYQIIKLREKMLGASKNFFTDDIASIQNGIFLGERCDIENAQIINFLKNGIYHLICTSGIHISIIMAIFLWIFKKLKLGQKLSHLLAIAPLLLFVFMAGFSLSAVRAGIMCVIYLLSMTLSKKPDPLSSLGLAVFLICLINPGSALSLGLWLSALAVLGITLFNKKIFLFLSAKLGGKLSNNLVIKGIISSVSVSVSVSIFTAPLTIFYSGIFSIGGVFTNIIFIPLTTAILISALILSTLWAFGAPALVVYPFAFVSGISVKFFIKLSEFFAKIPFCYVFLGYPFIKFWIGIVILTAAFSLILFKPAKALIYSSIISATSLICGIFSYQIFNFNRSQISFISGGESVACIIRKNGRTACIAYFGQKNYTKNFEHFLECSNIDGIDYFAVINSENLPDEFIKNTAKSHKISCFILPSASSQYISKNENNIEPVYFEKQLNSNIWGGDVIIESLAEKGHTYAKIKSDDIKVLIIPSGGNASNIPEDMRNCDIVLSYGIPKNFYSINCKSVIVYGPRDVAAKSIPKFPANIKIYNLAYYGQLNVMGENNNYKIGA